MVKPPRLVVGTAWCETRHCQVPYLYIDDTLHCYGYSWPETMGGSMVYVPIEEVQELVENKNKLIDGYFKIMDDRLAEIKKLTAELKALKNA